MNKKIMILYASVGGGHFKAADGIRAYITDMYPQYNVEMIDALHYTSKVVDKIVIDSYLNMAKYSPKVWGEIYKYSEKQYSVANFSNMVQKMLSQKLYKLFKEEQPDIVISTHPFITAMVASLKKHNKTEAKLCVVITDYASHKFWELRSEFVDMYFVANEETKYSMVHKGIVPSKIFVTGIPISPVFLKSYDKQTICSEFNLNPNKKIFIFFAGGQYGASNIKSFFNGLLAIKEDVQIVAIAGKSLKSQKLFNNLSKGSSKKIIVLGYTNKIPELMSIADFVISKPGGLTTTEILVSQVPFIIINPIPGQEEENANFLTNNGAAVRIWDETKATPIIEQLISDEFRLENMKAMQKHLAKPNSTEDIVETIIKNYLG